MQGAKMSTKISSLVLVISSLLSAQAMASKARLAALQGANHVVDTQTVFINPAHINQLGNYITFEMGVQGSGAEGGVTRKLSNGNVLGLYLGHSNSDDLRDGTTFLKQQNPVEATYGMGNSAFAVSVSTIDNKKSATKETTLVGKYGIYTDDMGAFVHLHVLSTAEKSGTTSSKLNGSPLIVLGGNKDISDNRFYGTLSFLQAKSDSTIGTTTTSTSTKDTNLSLGWEDRSLRTKDADIYYGLQLNSLNRDKEGKKITSHFGHRVQYEFMGCVPWFCCAKYFVGFNKR
jgi:hypothetical protein